MHASIVKYSSKYCYVEWGEKSRKNTHHKHIYMALFMDNSYWGPRRCTLYQELST